MKLLAFMLALGSGVAFARPSPAPAADENYVPRAPLGVPRVMATERPSGGPVIQLPPEEEGGAAAPSQAPPSAIPPERTSYFSTLKRKAEAIVNRTVLGGYGEFVFTKRQNEDSFFEARRFVAFLYSPIHERISVTAELEYEHGGSPLKREGQLQAGEAQLEFAVLDIKFLEQLVLRGGIVLVPMGRFNINHDAPTQDLTDRPLVITYIIPSTWFEAGAGLLGRQMLPRGLELNYECYFINGLDSKISDGLGYRAARGSKLNDNNDDKAIVGRLGLYYFGPIGKKTMQLDLGLSGYTGAYDRRGNRALIIAGDLGLRLAAFELNAEYVRAFNDPGFDDDFSISTRTPIPQHMWGMFVEARYHIMPERLRRALPEWLRESVFTLVVRWDIIDTDMTRKTLLGDRQRLTFGLNYRFVEAVVWKHELQLDHANAPKNPFVDPKLGYVTSLAFLF